MPRALWLLIAAAFASSCGYKAPTFPSLPPTAPSIPATITVTATPGVGGSAGQVFLAASVRDASGHGVGSVMVRFTTTSGVVQPDAVMADGGGLAQTTVRTSMTATIEATAGPAKSAIEVTPVAPPASR
jgi:hypothetical protein